MAGSTGRAGTGNGSQRRARGRAAVVALLVATGLVLTGGADAEELPPQQRTDLRVAMSDGVELEVKLGGRGPFVDGQLPARPTIVEFSPYGPACCAELAGPAYNYLQVHIRGTGLSAGSFDALGPRTQLDVAEVLDWACRQPWSDRRLGLYGFSASAITVYNSLHLELPCVQTAVLGSGTHELYRDLLYPGGVPNGIPAAGVFGLIGAPLVQNGPGRFQRDPASSIDAGLGMARLPVDFQLHPTLDDYWRERGFRGDVNALPILMVNGFFDVEARGPFQAFQELRDDGAHLLVVGAHDGVPAGSGGSDRQRAAWFDRYLRDVPNGIDQEPRVQALLANGDREDMLGGSYTAVSGDDWPLPGTQWQRLHLDPTRSGTARSINDGSLTQGTPAEAIQAYPATSSAPTSTDPHNVSILELNSAGPLTDMALAEPLGLSFTTEPFPEPVLAVGPATLELVLASTAPETDIWAVLSDVWPDGSAHPMAVGRLRSSYPGVDLERSLHDERGDIVQPYGRYDAPDRATIGEERRYHVELWPIGNRFDAGHRLRLHVLGSSAASLPTTPGINAVRLGEGQSRLLFPVFDPTAAPDAGPGEGPGKGQGKGRGKGPGTPTSP